MGAGCFYIKQPSGWYKRCLVAQGFSQVYGVDYDEIYALVVTVTTPRGFYANCAKKNLTIRQLDVSTAFFHVPLDAKVYMKQLHNLREDTAQGSASLKS